MNLQNSSAQYRIDMMDQIYSDNDGWCYIWLAKGNTHKNKIAVQNEEQINSFLKTNKERVQENSSLISSFELINQDNIREMSHAWINTREKHGGLWNINRRNLKKKVSSIRWCLYTPKFQHFRIINRQIIKAKEV